MDKENLLTLRSKEFVFTCLHIAGERRADAEIELLTDGYYCKTRFNMNRPVLKRVDARGVVEEWTPQDTSGQRRYYPDLIYIHGRRYIVCNDWPARGKACKLDSRASFADWVLR